jgi:hypothetical protein
MEGTLAVRFTASKSMNQCVVEVEDDGSELIKGKSLMVLVCRMRPNLPAWSVGR